MGKKKSSVKYSKEKIDGFFYKCEHLEEFESSFASMSTIAKTAILANPKKVETQRLVFAL